MEGNPCFPVDDTENRVKFLSKLLMYYEPTNLPLKTLNGKKVTIVEKVCSEVHNNSNNNNNR